MLAMAIIKGVIQISNLAQFSSVLFIFLNAQQIIKAIVLIGDIHNDLIVEFLQTGFNIDVNWIPNEYIPEITV